MGRTFAGEGQERRATSEADDGERPTEEVLSQCICYEDERVTLGSISTR